MMIAAWLFGIGGIAANFLIYQQNDRKRLLLVKLVANGLWTLHYALLGAWSGAGICAIGVLRESVFLNERQRQAHGKRWLIVFLLLSIACAALTWKNGFSILPTVASALSVFSFWYGDPVLTKRLSFPISLCFMTYNIACLSYVGILNEVIVLISAVIGLCRSRHKRSKK